MSDATPQAERPPVYRVSEVLGGLNRLLEDRVGRLWVAGEISNLRRAASGHAYLTLKDADAQLRAVLFRGVARRLAFEPEDGMEVLAYGDLGVYEPRGDLQLVLQALEPRGRGALQRAFEQLRRRLEAEGLFEAARKRPLPACPRVVGVVTSLHGAALRDVLHVLAARLPGQRLCVADARVQGLGAEHGLAAALAAMDAEPDVDVILVVRGGGSLEDLQPFNSERLARAIAACATPVVAGVGHEVDVTIADLAADLRAATPSAAAAAAIPDRRTLAARLERDARRLGAAGRGALARAQARLAFQADTLRGHAPRQRVAGWRQRLDGAGRRLEREARSRLAGERLRLSAAGRALAREGRSRLEASRARLGGVAGRLESLSPLGVLARGYAIARRGRDGAIVRSPADVEVGESLAVRVAEGEVEAAVRGRRDAAGRPLDP